MMKTLKTDKQRAESEEGSSVSLLQHLMVQLQCL